MDTYDTSAAINPAPKCTILLPRSTGKQDPPLPQSTGSLKIILVVQNLIPRRRRQIMLLGTGCLLTMLTEIGSGTLAGSAHQAAFNQVAKSDSKNFDKARIVNDAHHRSCSGRVLPSRGQES